MSAYNQDEEQRDNYIGKRTQIRAAEIRAKLAAGDAALIGQIDDTMGSMLFSEGSGFTWAGLIHSAATGGNLFAQLLDAAVAAEAQIMALKDAEAADLERAQTIADDQIEAARLTNAFLRYGSRPAFSSGRPM